MKIAVLLRGKQNFSKTTSTFFDTLVIKRFPKIDFKFFVHTWESLPVSPGTINSLKQITLPKSTILERIGHWKPASYELEEEKNLFDIIKNILKKQPIHNRNHTWVESQKNTLENYELINPFFIDRSLYEDINNIDQIINDPNINNNNHVRILRSIFSGFYLTGQMYSALKAFNLLKSYMKHKDYVPDLVICTRPDAVFSLDNEFFEKINRLLEKKNDKNISTIISSDVRIIKGRGWVQDYAFISDFKNTDDFLGGKPKERLVDLAFDHRTRTTGLLDSSGIQAHMLWPILGYKCIFIEANFFLSTLIRRELPEHNFTNINHRKIFKKISSEFSHWCEVNKSSHQLSDKDLLDEVKRIKG